jgi:hypothetical protein
MYWQRQVEVMRKVGFARPFLFPSERRSSVKNANTNRLFKPEKKNPADRADQATLAARAINEQEATAREKKTARLKQLRLEKEAAEAANAPAEPAKKRKLQKRK